MDGGDLNGDGKLDLVVANGTSNNVSVLLGNGLGSFAAATNLAFQGFPNSVRLGDLNGDSKLDLVISSNVSNTVSVLLGNGDGTFSLPTEFAVGTHPVSVVLGDFNGDSKNDIAVANFSSGDVSILINTCSTTNALPDRMAPGDFLLPGQFRQSADGRFRLVYQVDGNLVLYQGSTPLWGSGTSGTELGFAVMQGDGNFVVYDSTGPVWWSGTGTPGAFLVVQDDGNTVI